MVSAQAPSRSHVIDALSNLSPVLIKNVGTQTIPPYGLVQIDDGATGTTNATDGAQIGKDVALQVKRCDDAETLLIAANGAVAIPQGKQAFGYVGSLLPLLAPSGGTQIGDLLKPKVDDFTPEATKGPMLVYAVDSALGLVLVHNGGPGGEGSDITEFYIQTPIDPTTKLGKGVVVNLDGKGPVPNNTVIDLYDPIGIWNDLDIDAHGQAIAGRPVENPAQPGTDLDTYWIMEAERTWEYARVQLTADLFGNNSAQVTWGSAAGRSPENYTFVAQGEPTVIANPLGVDGIANTFVWLRRYRGTAAGYDRQWYVHRAESWKARYVVALIGQITGTEPNRDYAVTVLDWADGSQPVLAAVQLDALPIYRRPIPGEAVYLAYNKNVDNYFFLDHAEYFANFAFLQWTIPALASPNTCLTLDAQLTTVCSRSFFDGFAPGSTIKVKYPGYPIRCDTPTPMEGLCRFIREDSQDGEYVFTPLNTQSALLGNAQVKEIGVGDMEYTECDTGDTGDTFCNPDGKSGGWGLKQEKFNAIVFGCEPDPQNPPEKEPIVCIPKKDFLDDLCICEYICTYCEEFVGQCEPPPKCCCDCIFGSGEITVVIDTRTSISSVKLDECSWEVTMDDDSTVTVTYKCDGNWEIDDGLIYSLPDGDCTGVSQSSPIVINITVDGQVCTTGGECCPEMGPDSLIQNLDIGFGPEGTFVQLTDGVYIGDCTFEATGEWHEDDTGLPCDTGQGPTITPTTIYLQWDDTAGEWTVWGSPRSPIHNLGKVTTFTGTCCGFQDCGGGPECNNGPCDSTAGTGGITFDSQCIAPATAAAALTGKARAERAGQMLSKMSPHLVNKRQGCGCGSDDAVKLMDSWGCERSSEEIDRLVSEVMRGIKTSKIESVRTLTKEAVKQELLQAIQAEWDRIHAE